MLEDRERERERVDGLNRTELVTRKDSDRELQRSLARCLDMPWPYSDGVRPYGSESLPRMHTAPEHSPALVLSESRLGFRNDSIPSLELRNPGRPTTRIPH
jgi:hypothetical protein